MKKEQFKSLLDKYLTGMATDDEIRSLLNYYHSFEGEAADYPSIDAQELRDKLQALIQENERDKRVSAPVKWLVAASISLFLSFIGWWAYQHYDIPTATEKFATAKGEQKSITLSDGTEIKLNAGSQIQYPKLFTGKTREITLVGEAYFHVSKNPDKPFIIHTADMDIKVLGTVFNVKAYPEDETTETALISGSVAIQQRMKPQEVILLKPMEKFVLYKKEATLEQEKKVLSSAVSKKVETAVLPINMEKKDEPDAIAETGWLQGRIIFRDESLAAIARVLERYYDIDISFKKPVTANNRYSGTFENEELDSLFRSLQAAEYFNYRKEGKKIIIY